jgi:hypothetical protein
LRPDYSMHRRQYVPALTPQFVLGDAFTLV